MFCLRMLVLGGLCAIVVVPCRSSLHAAEPAAAPVGWLKLFDTELPFGWSNMRGLSTQNGVFALSSGSIARFVKLPTPGEIELEYAEGSAEAEVVWGDAIKATATPGQSPRLIRLIAKESTTEPTAPLTLTAPDGKAVMLTAIRYKPTKSRPMFNGKDLTGWKLFTGDPKRMLSKVSVTPAGEIALVNGPGDLQTTETFGNFLMQLDCRTNGTALNSGVFCRCIAEQYQNGYEVQIQNAFLENDRRKPADYGTGAIYRRIKAQRVIPNDREWFTLTILADGPTFTTWVNGSLAISWTDDRKPDVNPRKGLRTAPGHLSLQGHDPTTDLLFKNFTIHSW